MASGLIHNHRGLDSFYSSLEAQGLAFSSLGSMVSLERFP